MTNTPELREKLEEAVPYTSIDTITPLMPIILSEIEAAEKAKVEEVIEWVEFLQKTELRNDYRKLIKELKLHFKSLT